MPTTIVVAVVAVAIATGLVVWLVLDPGATARRSTAANLRRGLEGRVAASADAPTSLVRVRPDSFGRRLTPRPLVSLLERQHVRGGRPAGWPVDRLLAFKVWFGAIGAVLVVWAVAADARPLLTALLLVVTIGGYFLPDLLLMSRGQEREQKIERELADTVDQMMIAVEAGMGFDGAMARVAEHGRGVLAEELTRTLQDMRMGRSRRQALQDLAERAPVPDLRRFVRAILQADAYGISIGGVLRTQAAEMRLRRRQRAEEKAQKVPIKVLFPLMVCILPVLFIVILTPAAIDLYLTLSNI
ncbi:type II secretion system F family protein [Isoptericola variabilis]|uniref:Type II secretion system F domain protein n=1 Tax=Isoptericola variabilis (strain 225) TaxID=743718 RepID=F6FQU9_ISOV2|nr:type II secretion system F family protein [Isoptericola variabilis]AEG42914.1 Type II secretion system F domain protein [Isoptericola variabilis 225]TWH31837.1 tight adherence protein C [Isoptericola variabilis J7]